MEHFKRSLCQTDTSKHVAGYGSGHLQSLKKTADIHRGWNDKIKFTTCLLEAG